jgi:hypothetical protein
MRSQKPVGRIRMMFLWLLWLLALWSFPSPLQAELRVDVTPVAVTAPDRAMVILEASSLHWSAHLLYEDPIENRSLHVRFAGGLRMGEAETATFDANLQVSSGETVEYLRDESQSLLRIAQGVRLRDYGVSSDPAAQLPTPAVQYTVRLRSRDARALRLMWEAHSESWGTQFSVDGFNALGRAVFSEALRHSRIRQNASNQVLPWEATGLFETPSSRPEDLEGIPGLENQDLVPVHDIDSARHTTPLAFLYAAMLAGERSYADARTAAGVAGTDGLAGCVLPDRFSVDQTSLDSVDADLLSAAIAGGLERGGPLAPYLILIKRAQRFDRDARTLLLYVQSRLASPTVTPADLAAGVLAGDLLLDGTAVTNQALWENPEVVEAFLLGHIDPAVIPVWQCMAVRASRGVVEPTRTVAARNIGYAQFDEMFRARSWQALLQSGPVEIADAPRFFAAAHNVTRLFGVGFVDAVDLYGSPQVWAERFASLAFDASCTGWGDTLPPLIPTEGERDFLRLVNFDLYRNINLPIVREALRSGVLVDPTSGQPLAHEGPEGAAMAFDLRMVLAEQGRIEAQILAAVERGDFGLDDEAAWERLSNSQIALYCSRLADIARFANSDPEAQFQVIGGLQTLLDELVRRGVVAPEETGFRSYLWRVATGSAYVHLLHGASIDAYVEYIERLKLETADVRGMPQSLSPPLAQELIALAERQQVLDAEAERRWTEALATYLNPTDVPLRLFNCDVSAVPFALTVEEVTGPLLTRVERIAALNGTAGDDGAATGLDGLGPVAVAFDLSASGDGALLPNARIDGTMVDAQTACQGIASRYEALDGLMTVLDSTMAFISLSDVDRVLVLDRSVRLAETQSRIEPFLLAGLRDGSGVPNDPENWTRDDLAALVSNAFAAEGAYQRGVAIARRLAILEADDFAALDLSIVQEEVGRLAANAALATAPTDEDLTKAEAGAAMAAANGLEARVARVAQYQRQLDNLRTRLCLALAACDEASTPRDVGNLGPLRPIPVTYPYPHLTEEEVVRGLGSTADLSPATGLVPVLEGGDGILAGSGLYYRITSTDDVDSQGRRMEEAELVYRLPQPVGRMVADVVPEAGSRGATDGIAAMEGLSALTQVREIPLGVNFTHTYVDTVSGVREISNEVPFFLRRNVTALNAAARALGLADWIEITHLHSRSSPGAEVEGIKNLRNVTLYLEIEFLGEAIPGRVPLPLITDGAFSDPGQALRRALTRHVEEAASAQLRDIIDRLGPMRFPTDPEVFETAQVRFGPVGDRAVDVRFDWESGTLTAGFDYALRVGTSEVRAIADLLIEPTGALSIINAQFVGAPPDLLPALRDVPELAPVLDGIEVIAAGLASAQVELQEVAADLQAVPVITGDRVSIMLRQSLTLSIAGRNCGLAFQARLPLDLDRAEDAFYSAVESVLSEQLAACAVAEGTRQLFSALSDLDVNPSITVFGTTATLGFGEDGALSLDRAAQVLDSTRSLPVQLRIERSDCRTPVDVRVRGGVLVPQDNGIRLDLQSLPPSETAKLAQAMACAIEGILPSAIREYVNIDAVNVFSGTVLVDATVRGVPFLSEVPLRRINLTDPGASLAVVEGIVRDIAVDALGAGLDTALREVFGDRQIDLAGIGRFTFTSTRVETGGARWWIVLNGRLNISDYTFDGTTVRIPVGGSLSEIDVRMPDANAVVGAALGEAIVSMLPMIGADPPITNLYFGRLDAAGTLYGLRFDVQAGIPLGDQSVDVEIRKASLSMEGISLGAEVTAAIPLPLYFGPVALSQVLLTLVTGEEEGTRRGLRIGADLTAVEPQFARVLKLRSILDLTEIDRLAFSLESTVIAFDSLTLMEAEGRLDLANSFASFDARASGVVADIIDPQMEGRLDGRVGLVYARSSLDVFGERINENELELCSSECVTDGVPGEARISFDQNLLLGDANGGARTDLAFRDPSLRAGMDLNLFGWRPGGAGFAVDLGGAELNMSFLGINVTILTPSYQTMDPAFVARVLKDLLKIDLSSLLELDPADITISLMSATGEVSSNPQNTESDGDGDQGQESSAGGVGEERGHDTGPPRVGPDEDEQAGPPRADEVVPPQETWGVAVTARVCERYVGTDDGPPEIPANHDHLYYIYGARADDNNPSWLWDPWEFDLPDWYSWPALGGIAAHELCTVRREIGGGVRWEVPSEVVSVGAARQILRWRTTCNDDGSPSVALRQFQYPTDDAAVRARYRNAGLPLLCIETETGDRLQVNSRLYVDNREVPQVVLIPYCPPRTRGWTPEGRLGEAFTRLCRSDIRAPRFALAESGFDFAGEVSVLTARDELRFYEQVVYPRLLGTGAPGETGGSPWTAHEGRFTATPNEIVRGSDVAWVSFLIERNENGAELGTARLERLNPDGSDNVMFDLYLRAKSEAADTMWRPLFLELFDRLLRTGEPLDFITRDFSTARHIAVRTPELDIAPPDEGSHGLQAISWLWFDENGLQQRVSYLPSQLPTLDGDIGYNRDALTHLAETYFAPVLAQSGSGPPLRAMFGLAVQQERQQIVVFADPACEPLSETEPGACPGTLGHVDDDTLLRVTLARHADNRAKLADWIGSDGQVFTGCITRGDLADALSQITGRRAAMRDIDALFFDLAGLSARMPDMTAEPERALSELRACP